MKKHNFYAGPSILSEYAINNTIEGIRNFADTGLSVLEISHRSKEFQAVIDGASALVKELLDIPEGYSVLWLGGGASLQFCMMPYNFLKTKAAFTDTGTWAHNAIKEAGLFGEALVLASSADANYSFIPKGYTVPEDVDYFHYTSNNTIYGTEWQYVPDTGDVPIVCDMSSNFLSRPVDVSKYGIIFGGAQKNLAPAGLTIAVVREDLAGHELPYTPLMMNYKTMIDKDSMYNTPPCWCIYMLGLVLEWLDEQGGVEGMEKIKHNKAALLYDVLDNSRLFTCAAEKASRSDMNVTFRSVSEELDAKFVKEATAAGFTNLKGHRNVGGMRASIYNAMPVEGVERLADFIREFDKNN